MSASEPRPEGTPRVPLGGDYWKLILAFPCGDLLTFTHI